jgi:hypothetical protein
VGLKIKIKGKGLILVLMTLFVYSKGIASTLENEMVVKGYSSSLRPGLFRENEIKKTGKDFDEMALVNRFELALKSYDWRYPSLRPFFDRFYRKKEKGLPTLNLSVSWAAANLSPLVNSYLFQNNGWDCDGLLFKKGDIQELLTAFIPWEIGTRWGRGSSYGGRTLEAHDFHEAIHLHLFTGEGLLFFEKNSKIFYPILKVKSSFKELSPQQLVPFLDFIETKKKWFGKKEKLQGPSIVPSKFFKGRNKEGKKALNVVRFVEKYLELMAKNENISLGEIKKKIVETSFFGDIFRQFEGQFKKYKTKKKLFEILARLRQRYFRHALYNNSIDFIQGIRVEKVETEIHLKKPGNFGNTKDLKEKLSLTYFLFQRKGQKGFNQKFLGWQDSWKKSMWRKIKQIENQKGPFWKIYSESLRKKVNKKWYLTSLGKKSNYFIMGSSWLEGQSFRPTFLLSIKSLTDKSDQLAPLWGQWFFNVWDENDMPGEESKDLFKRNFYELVGKGIALKGVQHLFNNCTHLK